MQFPDSLLLKIISFAVRHLALRGFALKCGINSSNSVNASAQNLVYKVNGLVSVVDISHLC